MPLDWASFKFSLFSNSSSGFWWGRFPHQCQTGWPWTGWSQPIRLVDYFLQMPYQSDWPKALDLQSHTPLLALGESMSRWWIPSCIYRLLGGQTGHFTMPRAVDPFPVSLMGDRPIFQFVIWFCIFYKYLNNYENATTG